MRQLTFSGFTERYVISLSKCGRSAIYPLVREMVAGNARLKAPLYLYALSNNRLNTLLMASKDTSIYDEYFALSNRYSLSEMTAELSQEENQLPEEYQKVWRSYISVATMHKRDERVKELMRTKILMLQKELGITTYQLCKELNLNTSNVNAWLKNNIPAKVSLAKAQIMLTYLENAGGEIECMT